jgi:WD40 repeat protein
VEQELWGKPEEAGYDQHWLEAEEVYRRIKAQMDFWMNEAELDFFRKSFAKQGDEIAKLIQERDDARATALAAKAMLINQTDQTIALNLAKKAVDFYKNPETESVFQELLQRKWIGYYQYNFNRHQGSVDAVAFGGKKWAATGSADQTAMIWDLRTGKWIRTLEGHSGKITSVSFHVSGSLLTTSADHSAILWDVRSGNKRWTCRQEGPITAGVFAPDGTSVLTGSSDGKVICWDLLNGQSIKLLFHQPAGITSLDFSPDGSHLLVGLANKTVLLWSMESGEVVRSFGNKYGYQDEMRGIFSLTGTYALTHSTTDARITLWDWKTGEEKRTFSGDQMKAACFLARDRQVITTDRNQLKFWSISSMMDKPAHMTFLGHSKPVQAVAVSGQSLLTGSRDKTAKLWYWPLAIYQGEEGKAKEKRFHEAIRTGWHPKVYQLSKEELAGYGVLGK